MNDYIFATAIILYVFFVAFFLYVCVLADPRKSRIARKITIELPQLLYSACEERILGTDRTESLAKLHKALFRERNSVLQILYLILVLGGWSIMFTYGYAHIPNKYVPEWHRYSGLVCFFACMTSFRMACRTHPGYITARNIDRFDNYPYDNILYKEANICPTAKIRKLARSKYDRMTKGHVARFDHYCAWINQAVGEENYRTFLLFLIVQVVMCWYGSIIHYYIFKNEIEELQLWRAKFINAKTKMEVDANIWVVLQFLFARHGPMAAHLLLMSVMALILSSFLLFHLHLIVRGMTTNEFYKWRNLRRKKLPHSSNESDFVKESEDSINTVKQKTNRRNRNGDSSDIPDNSKKEDGSDPREEISFHNIYNLGIIENFMEVISPRSLRPMGEWRGFRHAWLSGYKITSKMKTS